MKDIRGSHASAVRGAIFRHFKLPAASTWRKNSMDISEWKRSKDVNDSYKKLYTDAETLETIVDIAFPSLSMENEEEYSDIVEVRWFRLDVLSVAEECKQFISSGVCLAPEYLYGDVTAFLGEWIPQRTG
jgi:hypothetical protein